MTNSRTPERAAPDARTTKTVLALPGSLRRGSYNRLLLEAAVGCAPAGMEIPIYDGLGSVPLFNEDLESATGGGPDEVRRLRRLVASADGLLIATPEYNQSLPGVLKNAIDWLSRPDPEEVLDGKPVSVIGATSGPWGARYAQSQLRQVLYATGSLVAPPPTMFVREAGSKFDDAGRLLDQRTRETMEEVLVAFDDWIELVGRGPRIESRDTVSA